MSRVRTPSFSSSALLPFGVAASALGLVLLVLALAAFGCGASQPAPNVATAPPSVTAGDMASRVDEPPAEAAQSAQSESRAASAEKPPGQLACKTQSRTDGVTELYLEWTGDEAKGVLRSFTPSGMVHEQRVRAERHGRMIIADDVNSETDLVVHTATVHTHDGKTYLRVGDGSQPWQTCE